VPRTIDCGISPAKVSAVVINKPPPKPRRPVAKPTTVPSASSAGACGIVAAKSTGNPRITSPNDLCTTACDDDDDDDDAVEEVEDSAVVAAGASVSFR